MAGERLERRAPARPQAIALLRRDVVAYAAQLGASPAAGKAIAHAVSEALTNAVVHGYADQEPGELAVEAWHDEPHHMLVRISDEGQGMVAHPDRPGLGLGLNLMAEMADDVRLREEPHARGTTVSMRFALDGSQTRIPHTDAALVLGAEFEIREQAAEGQRIVSPRGELDLAGADLLERRLGELARTQEPTVIDLSGLSFIDSSGITALMRAKQSAQKRSWQLELRDPSPQVLRVMQLTRVDVVLGLAP